MELKAIVFDLGGVLVNLEGQPIKNEWMSDAESFEDNWRRWLFSPIAQAFERGEIEIEAFAKGLIAQMQLNVDQDTFIKEFTAWPKDFFAGVFDLMPTLKEQVQLAIFSNITAAHWPKYCPQLEAAHCFSHLFASYQIGMAKPDPAAFTYIAQQMGVAEHAILFLDDNQVNVEGARKAGLQAERTVGLPAVVEILTSKGVNCH